MADVACYVRLADASAPEGSLVGAVADTGGRITFEYARDYRGESISPLLLPRMPGRVFEFPELRRLPAFGGLPGVLADSLPDRFGTRLVEEHFRRRGTAPHQLSPVQKLAYIGTRGMGALTFHPALDLPGLAQAEVIDLTQLRVQAQQVVRGEMAVALPEIMGAASSVGGARAKALVFWNRASDQVAIGLHPPAGFEYWIVKFDSLAADGALQSWTRIERAYGEMAAAAGINVPEERLFDDGAYRHFGVRRFDRDANGVRYHYHSLAGLLHVDYNERHALGYEALLQSCLDLHLGEPALEEGFRRMVFNVVARNQDDHPKNLGFLMQPSTFRWALAPAFDLCFAADSPWTTDHQMTVNGKAAEISRGDLLAVAASFDLPASHASRIVEQVVDAVSRWTAFAAQADVPKAITSDLARRHRLDLGRGE